MLLQGKVALITGASRGIGKGIALEFARQGAIVCFTCLVEDELSAAVVAEINALGGQSKVIVADAAELEASTSAIDQVVEAFGKIDILVNNAGITKDTLLLRMTEAQWDDVIRINLKSVFANTKAAIKYMMKQRSGSIINISSVVGMNGNAGQSNYAASKAGIIGFTQSVAQEMGGRNIRCNAIAPGFIVTEMTAQIPEKEREAWTTKIPLQRAGTTEDIANACVFLASDLSTYITGQTLAVDGGMT